jgi:hypothetical protein
MFGKALKSTIEKSLPALPTSPYNFKLPPLGTRTFSRDPGIRNFLNTSGVKIRKIEDLNNFLLEQQMAELMKPILCRVVY